MLASMKCYAVTKKIVAGERIVFQNSRPAAFLKTKRSGLKPASFNDHSISPVRTETRSIPAAAKQQQRPHRTEKSGRGFWDNVNGSDIHNIRTKLRITYSS